MTRRLSIIIPLIGLVIVLVWVTISARKVQHVAALASPAVSPYDHAIAATGIVEASNRNYNLGPPVSGQLTAIYVREGDTVRRGDKLYTVDNRPQRSAVETAEANVAKARAQIDTAESSVQMQGANLNSAKAAIATARATYEDAKQIAERNEGLHSAGIISEQQYVTSTKSRDAEMARLDQAIAQQRQAEEAVQNARSQVGEQQANLRSTVALRNQEGTRLDQLTVRAPADGKILQVNNRVGEYLSSTAGTTPVLFGDTDSLMVRVDVDEINASRVQPGSDAVATLKGDSSRSFPLHFVRIVPYMVPKQNLTGQNSERVDVRVLQLEFRFTPPAFPVYVGQQVDVFIQSPPR